MPEGRLARTRDAYLDLSSDDEWYLPASYGPCPMCQLTMIVYGPSALQPCRLCQYDEKVKSQRMFDTRA